MPCGVRLTAVRGKREQAKARPQTPGPSCPDRLDRLCAILDPRKPLSKVFKIVKSLRSCPQQIHLFRALAVSRQVSKLAVADEVCAHIAHSTTPAKEPPAIAADALAVPPQDSMWHSVCKDWMSCDTSSSPGLDGVRYSILCTFGESARCRLLEFLGVRGHPRGI